MNFQRLYAVIVLLSLNCYAFAFQEEGKKLSFQGTLYENGQPVDGTRSFTFNIALDDGASWTETQSSINVAEGFYSVTLGNITPIPFDIFFDAEERQLDISVEGNQIGTTTIYAPFARGDEGGIGNLSLEYNDPQDSVTFTSEIYGDGLDDFGEFAKGIKGIARTNHGNTGVFGLAESATGNNKDQTGIMGEAYSDGTGWAIGVWGKGYGNGGDTNYGLRGEAYGNARQSYAIRGLNFNEPPTTNGLRYGGYFSTNGSSAIIRPGKSIGSLSFARGSEENIGVWGRASGPQGTINYAGLFDGDVRVNNGDIEIFGTATTSALGDFQVVNGANGSQEAQLTLSSTDGRSFTLTPDGISASTGPIDPNPTFDNVFISNYLSIKNPTSTGSEGVFIYPNGGINASQSITTNNVFTKSFWLRDRNNKSIISAYETIFNNADTTGKIKIESSSGKYAETTPYGFEFGDDQGFQFGLYNADGFPLVDLINTNSLDQSARLDPSGSRAQIRNQAEVFLEVEQNTGGRLWLEDYDKHRIIASSYRGAIEIGNGRNGSQNEWLNLTRDGISLGEYGSSDGFFVYHNAGTSTFLNIKENNNNALSFNSAVGNLEISGSLAQSSDRRLKKNIKTINVDMSDIRALRGVRYAWKENKRSQENLGFIAQEVEAIFPELVITKEDGFKAVKYAEMSAILLEAVKHLDERITSLENENLALNTENDRLSELEVKLANLESLLLKVAQDNQPKN